MSKHTPGPWLYEFPEADGLHLRELDCFVTANGALVASVSHGHIYPSEPYGSEVREANARLIAAAPDMLEALQSLTHSLELGDMFHDDQRAAFAAARAAIAKATHGEPT